MRLLETLLAAAQAPILEFAAAPRHRHRSIDRRHPCGTDAIELRRADELGLWVDFVTPLWVARWGALATQYRYSRQVG